MMVTDCNCHGIGGVVGTWDLFQAQQDAYHLLHLRLVGSSISNDRLFDRLRFVFEHREVCFGGGQQHHAARLPHSQRRRDVAAEE